MNSTAVQHLGVDEETGKEVLYSEKTFKDSGEAKEKLDPSPQIATEQEPPATELRRVTVSDVEKALEKESSDPPDPVEVPKIPDPKAVIFDKSGAVKHDGLKPRVDLIPPEVIFAMGEMFRHGADKYSDRNWEMGMNWSRIFGSTMRHLWAWWGGEDIDPDSKQPHLHSAACCIAMLVAYRKRKLGKDDREVHTPDSQ